MGEQVDALRRGVISIDASAGQDILDQAPEQSLKRRCTSWEQVDALRRGVISIDATQGQDNPDQAPDQSLMRLYTSWEQVDALRRGVISNDTTRGQESQDVLGQASQNTQTFSKNKVLINGNSKVGKDGILLIQDHDAACGGDCRSVELLWSENGENFDVNMLTTFISSKRKRSYTDTLFRSVWGAMPRF